MSVIEREIIAYISPEKKKKGHTSPSVDLSRPPPLLFIYITNVGTYIGFRI